MISGTTVFADSPSSRSNLNNPGQPSRTESVPLGEAGDATLNLDSHMGVFPAASVATGTPKDITSPTVDFVAQGVVSLADAQDLFSYFLEHLNHHLHGILSDGDTLAAVRTRSSILTAAICTVASLCSSSDSHKSCYDAFVAQVSSMLFATSSSYDDVRALCIAAFWLDDIGPRLNGLGKTGTGP